MIVEMVRDMFAALTLDGTNPRDPAISAMLGLGREATSGVSVTHDTVMAIPAVKRAVQIITDKIFGMPWYVFREEADGREWDRTHPAWRCVSTRANPDLDDATLRQQLTQWAILWGNGCAAIHRPKGWPDSGHVELYPLLPDRTRMERVSRRIAERVGDPTIAGQLVYLTTIGGEEMSFARDDVLHIRGLGPNPYWGWDIVDLLIEAFGGVMAKEQFGNRFFGQGANPAGFITMDGRLDEEAEENFIASLQRGLQGLGNAHRAVLLEEGAKFTPVTIDPQKSQMIEGRQFDVRTIAMAIGIKVHKLIDGANSAFASLEQANQEHKDDDILPWVNKWRKEYSAKLLSDDQQAGGTHSIDVDDEQLEWVPFSERSSGVVELYNNGLIDKDEGRRKVNFGPSRSRRSKQFRIPANIVYEDDASLVHVTPGSAPADDDDDTGAGAASANGDESSAGDSGDDMAAELAEQLDEMRADYVARMTRRLRKTAQAKAKQGASTLLAWLDALEAESSPSAVAEAATAAHEAFVLAVNEIAGRVTTDEQLREAIDAI